ncbi:MAG: tetratricopeptide repeat protein [Deltaproteobacteria bacterium]|nr:tetratricopeptide repeat protein [Deltaproteobacteria bacterium]
MSPFLLLLLTATTTASAAQGQELRAQVLAAQATELLAEGRTQEALPILEAAVAASPDAPSLRRDLAQVLLQLDRTLEAAGIMAPLMEQGPKEPETLLLAALIEARLGQRSRAMALAEESDTWEGRLVGSALGDPVAAHRTIELFEEETPRGAAAALLLASREGARGELGAARGLANLAEGQAEAAGSLVWLEAARDLSRRLDERSQAPIGSLRLRSALDYSTNPAFVTGRVEPRTPALRLALTAEGGAELTSGRWSGSGSIRVDHHTFLSERDELQRLDLFAYAVAAGVHYALSRNPSSAVIGLVVRFSDVFGDYFRLHYATSIEGGPNLTLRIAPRLQLQLGLYGQAIDFIDVSPPDRTLSSLNRDRVGQRAVLALRYDVESAYARAEGMFLHDSALGDAFDAIGGAVALRGGVQPVDGVLLEGGVALTLRDFGPVGDEAIIGPAATRSELRVAAELGIRVVVSEHVDLLVEYLRITTNARADHEYVETLLSMGMEARW